MQLQDKISFDVRSREVTILAAHDSQSNRSWRHTTANENDREERCFNII